MSSRLSTIKWISDFKLVLLAFTPDDLTWQFVNLWFGDVESKICLSLRPLSNLHMTSKMFNVVVNHFINTALIF